MLYIDIETYSSVDLKLAGPYRYAESPDFKILMAAWSVDGGPVTVETTDLGITTIPGLGNPHVATVAHNAQFERICLSRYAGLPVGQYLDPAAWVDSMALAAEHGYPQKLEHLARALGGEQKDSAGTRLINLFCKPNRAGRRVLPEERPDEWAAFVEYCAQDVRTLADVYDHVHPFPTDMERWLWVVDQRINDRGVRLDQQLAANAVAAAEENRMLQELEISDLTGVANPGSQPQMLAWLQRSGLDVANLQKETIAALLARTDLDAVQRRVLELRQELALVASKKYVAALAGVSADGRLRGAFRFFGAHTGRWAGRGVQLHNLPRAALASEAHAEAAVLDLAMGLGASAQTLKALVRPLFTGPFYVIDYAAIEARVLAWLADERWALEAFYAGRDIYTETAGRMGKNLTRSQGKVAVLALGFNGGVGSLRVMGAEGSDVQLQALVDQWRRANPRIVAMWSRMEDAFRIGDAPVGKHLFVQRTGTTRRIQLPSGRSIGYHGVACSNGRLSFDDPKKPDLRADTYGGRLIENVTQAVARDVLGEALIRLEAAGVPVVGHVHDEIIIEAGHDPALIHQLVTQPPAWAAGMPIAAEGFTTQRYRKGA